MKHDMIRRFAFIEAQLLWGGGLTAQGLADTFGIARPNAQQTIRQYVTRHPGQMSYDRASHRQKRTDGFSPAYIRPEVERFLDYQRAVNQIAHFFDEPDWADLPFVDADALVPRYYLNGPIGLVLEALRNQTAVEIEYWSKSGTQVRCISPHHLVFADGRYHVRAFCHERKDGRDFVLTRIFAAQPAAEERIGEGADIDWHMRVDLCFRINPALPEQARLPVRMDHIVGDGDILKLSGIRAALADYVRRRLCRPDATLGIPLWLQQNDRP